MCLSHIDKSSVARKENNALEISLWTTGFTIAYKTSATMLKPKGIRGVTLPYSYMKWKKNQ